MTLKYLADTNIVSELMKLSPHPAIVENWQRLEHLIAVSSITWHELLLGVSRLPQSKRKKSFEVFLQDHIVQRVPILPYGQEAAQWQAHETARLMKIGQTPPFADGQIAAVAATQKLILVTRNSKDFSKFDTIQVENWFK